MEQNNDSQIDISLPTPPAPEKPPKRPPMNPEHRLYSINSLVLVSVIAAISCFLIFGKRSVTSSEENRDLAKCPKFSLSSYFDGTFTAEFSEFFNDTVPMRSFFKGVISDFRGSLGVPYDDGVILIGGVPAIEQEEKETEPHTQFAPMEVHPTVPTEAVQTTRPPMQTTAPAETTTAATTVPEEQEEDFEGEIANNILIVKDRGLMLYGGTKSNAEYYAETLNAYKEALGDGVRIYSLVAPTAVSYYLPKKYESYSASEKDNIEYLNTHLEGVTPVDAFSILEEHKNEAIFSRTDHHWQPLGAYYAAKAFAKTANVPFAELSAYETVQLDGYVGTLYGYTSNAVFKDNPEPFIYYKPTNRITTTYFNADMTNEREGSLMLRDVASLHPSSWYLVFMGGDDRITRITTDCQNGRRLMIIKDSYGNALVPCLTSSFSEIWVVDMRYFEPSAIEFAKEHGITDLLFAMNTFSATGGNAKKLESIMD